MVSGLPPVRRGPDNAGNAGFADRCGLSVGRDGLSDAVLPSRLWSWSVDEQRR